MADDDMTEMEMRAAAMAMIRPQTAGRIADDVRALVAEVRRLRHKYAADSCNGDVIDWLYTWLMAPNNATCHAMLETFLARGGYANDRVAHPAGSPLAVVYAADGFVTPPAHLTEHGTPGG